ncbi:MAG: L-2-hydroxyglutarate oxidase [Planctomycetaceae bacterium]|nr:L-2-hydroxyglutarate oxidase [Planctomycetaceae bacterium]
MSRTDVVIVGGGIVGLASAYQLVRRFPTLHVTILEKEAELGSHQTGHNSGVLHSGIYYKPGSLRATNCRTGKQAMEEFCEAEGVPYEICGKVIVAVNEAEFPQLEQIYQRGQENGVRCEMISGERLAELEPHTAGIKAIHVPEAGICDFRKVCLKLAERLQEREAIVQTNARVTRILKQENSVVVESTAGSFEARYLVNCAGLHSDRVASLTGFRAASKIVPFRGEYYDLKPHVENLCRNLIYPVPNPKFPFLGVHFTRMINGGVECGPNAVLAFAREGYRKRDVNLYDLGESLTYPGFLRLARKNWRAGCGEMWRSFSKRAFVRALQRLVPSIRGQDLVAARAGVRAQALARDGQLVDDFRIRTDECIVNVDNAPSPAATSSLNIGRLVAETLAQQI